MNKLLRFMFLGLLVLILASGCGKSDTGSNVSGSNSGTSEPASASQDTKTNGPTTLDKIRETKVLKVGTDATFPPFEFKNEQGEYDGFDIDLIHAVAEELGVEKVEFVDTEFKGLIPGLQAKHFDVIASAMYITEERRETIEFSDPYFPGGLSIMVKKDNDEIQSIEDLKGKKVSVQIGTKSLTFLNENYPEIETLEFEKNVEMFMALETGRADAVVTGRPAALVYAKESGNVKVLDQELTEELYGYGIRKEDEDLREEINKALKTLRDNGKYQEIVNKWFGE